MQVFTVVIVDLEGMHVPVPRKPLRRAHVALACITATAITVPRPKLSLTASVALPGEIDSTSSKKVHAHPSLVTVWDVEEFCGLALGALAAAVVSGGGLDAGVPGHLLDGGDVGAGVEQVADEGAPQVMGAERRRGPPPAPFSLVCTAPPGRSAPSPPAGRTCRWRRTAAPRRPRHFPCHPRPPVSPAPFVSPLFVPSTEIQAVSAARQPAGA